jgi:hypothetical protein
MFGGINALFAGLAFAGLIYTIYLQRDELRLQREELELTRIELSRTATAQEQSENRLSEQVTSMNASVKAKSLIFLIEYLQDVEKVEARRIVIQDLSKKELSKWTDFRTFLKKSYPSGRIKTKKQHPQFAHHMTLRQYLLETT